MNRQIKITSHEQENGQFFAIGKIYGKDPLEIRVVDSEAKTMTELMNSFPKEAVLKVSDESIEEAKENQINGKFFLEKGKIQKLPRQVVETATVKRVLFLDKNRKPIKKTDENTRNPMLSETEREQTKTIGVWVNNGKETHYLELGKNSKSLLTKPQDEITYVGYFEKINQGQKNEFKAFRSTETGTFKNNSLEEFFVNKKNANPWLRKKISEINTNDAYQAISTNQKTKEIPVVLAMEEGEGKEFVNDVMYEDFSQKQHKNKKLTIVDIGYTDEFGNATNKANAKFQEIVTAEVVAENQNRIDEAEIALPKERYIIRVPIEEALSLEKGDKIQIKGFAQEASRDMFVFSTIEEVKLLEKKGNFVSKLFKTKQEPQTIYQKETKSNIDIHQGEVVKTEVVEIEEKKYMEYIVEVEKKHPNFTKKIDKKALKELVDSVEKAFGDGLAITAILDFIAGYISATEKPVVTREEMPAKENKQIMGEIPKVEQKNIELSPEEQNFLRGSKKQTQEPKKENQIEK